MNEEGTSQEQELTCPFMLMRPQTLDDSVRRLVKSSNPNACLGDRCAWWDSEAAECAVLTIGMAARVRDLK